MSIFFLVNKLKKKKLSCTIIIINFLHFEKQYSNDPLSVDYIIFLIILKS